MNVPLIDYYNIVAASSLADRDATAASSERAAKANTTTLAASFADRAAEGGYDVSAYIPFLLGYRRMPLPITT